MHFMKSPNLLKIKIGYCVRPKEEGGSLKEEEATSAPILHFGPAKQKYVGVGQKMASFGSSPVLKHAKKSLRFHVIDTLPLG